jgi:hypothetical protein
MPPRRLESLQLPPFRCFPLETSREFCLVLVATSLSPSLTTPRPPLRHGLAREPSGRRRGVHALVTACPRAAAVLGAGLGAELAVRCAVAGPDGWMGRGIIVPPQSRNQRNVK